MTPKTPGEAAYNAFYSRKIYLDFAFASDSAKAAWERVAKAAREWTEPKPPEKPEEVASILGMRVSIIGSDPFSGSTVFFFNEGEIVGIIKNVGPNVCPGDSDKWCDNSIELNIIQDAGRDLVFPEGITFPLGVAGPAMTVIFSIEFPDHNVCWVQYLPRFSGVDVCES